MVGVGIGGKGISAREMNPVFPVVFYCTVVLYDDTVDTEKDHVLPVYLLS